MPTWVSNNKKTQSKQLQQKKIIHIFPTSFLGPFPPPPHAHPPLPCTSCTSAYDTPSPTLFSGIPASNIERRGKRHISQNACPLPSPFSSTRSKTTGWRKMSRPFLSKSKIWGAILWFTLRNATWTLYAKISTQLWISMSRFQNIGLTKSLCIQEAQSMWNCTVWKTNLWSNCIKTLWSLRKRV